MIRVPRKLILVLLAGVLSALPAGAQDIRETQPWLAEDLSLDGMTREELVSLYQSLAPDQFQPPACVAGQPRMFTDVPATHPFCAWIEELARRGITGGCTATRYCPGNPVNRAQMAAFVVRSMEACPTMDPTDEMVRVGGICIDKYEASIWNAPVGGSQILGAIPCAANGQNCDNIYARSVAGVTPRTGITWFQAQAALENSGKRYPSNAEWQMAARGTPDHAGPCNTNGVGVSSTGSSSGCVSRSGAMDMVGNVWEWVADWVPRSVGCGGGWPAGYGNDFQCLAGAETTGAPGALARGGSFANGAGAGPFSVTGSSEPSSSNLALGFRGAR